MYINDTNSQFKKTGEEFKKILKKKIGELQMRLAKRNEILEGLLNDRKRLRSYLLRSANPNFNGGGHVRTSNISSFGPEHIGIEEVEEIKHLCSRIFEIENEIKTCQTLENNLKNEDTIRLSLSELLQYGFE